MKDTNKFYITSPIYYVNGIPHIGHFYSSILADTIARFKRINGKETRFTTGVDENSQKAISVAEKKGMKIMDYLDDMALEHKNVWDSLKLNYTDFIRTTEERHHKVVKEVLQNSYDNGDIYEGEYEGMYCIGCEAFKKDDDLIEYEGKQVCPAHFKVPDKIKEKNYFFKLSKYQTWIEEFYEANPNFVQPEERFNEVIAFTKRGLEDFSISRETNTFGIKLPFDETQVTYVWFDALYNYYTSVKEESGFFPADVHVVGKDIIRFHAIFWPAMLASNFKLGENDKNGVLHYKESDKGFLPKTILTTGFFTVDGIKMSKTLLNVIDPVKYSKEYSKDVLTLYLLGNSNIGYDGDFDNKQAILTYNAKLANNFGNLLNRVVVLGNKLGGELKSGHPQGDAPTKYNNIFSTNLSDYNLKSSLDETFSFLDSLNKFVDTEKPWELLKSNPEKAEEILYILAEGLRQVGLNLYSFFPQKMEELFERLGLKNYKEKLEAGELEELRNKTEIFKIVKKEGILFERFEIPEDEIKIEEERNIKISINKDCEELGLHIASALIEVPKIITRRNGGLKKYIKQELENIDFDNKNRLDILSKSQKFYDKNGVKDAVHPSVHLQRIVEGSGKLPNINNVVDCYNIESLKSGLSIGVHDITKIIGDEIVIKISDGNELFLPLGGKKIINIKPGEYACSDDNGKRIICRMDCKQSNETLVDKDTKKIFIYAQGNSACDKKYLEKTINQVIKNLENFCGAKF